ncbi:hypothetical protein GCM10023340_14870 [Nocardioides marinquilinus]|uniref:Uncharacterized protein n=1 Tax=Nocardioides marinquilinus TaxID=1210400 RepID=A0ABP9PI27_9ACTN
MPAGLEGRHGGVGVRPRRGAHVDHVDTEVEHRREVGHRHRAVPLGKALGLLAHRVAHGRDPHPGRVAVGVGVDAGDHPGPDQPDRETGRLRAHRSCTAIVGAAGCRSGPKNR